MTVIRKRGSTTNFISASKLKRVLFMHLKILLLMRIYQDIVNFAAKPAVFNRANISLSFYKRIIPVLSVGVVAHWLSAISEAVNGLVKCKPAKISDCLQAVQVFRSGEKKQLFENLAQYRLRAESTGMCNCWSVGFQFSMLEERIGLTWNTTTKFVGW